MTALSKSNEILEMNVLQKFSLHALFENFISFEKGTCIRNQ